MKKEAKRRQNYWMLSLILIFVCGEKICQWRHWCLWDAQMEVPFTSIKVIAIYLLTVTYFQIIGLAAAGAGDRSSPLPHSINGSWTQSFWLWVQSFNLMSHSAPLMLSLTASISLQLLKETVTEQTALEKLYPSEATDQHHFYIIAILQPETMPDDSMATNALYNFQIVITVCFHFFWW